MQPRRGPAAVEHRKRSGLVTTIVSGGQTGADTGALNAARELGLSISGFANQGFRTEKGPKPELASLGLRENDRPSYASTDRKNVDLSDALIAFRYSIPRTGRGTECTVHYARTRSYEHVTLSPPASTTDGTTRACVAYCPEDEDAATKPAFPCWFAGICRSRTWTHA
jgi:hypothetical protein